MDLELKNKISSLPVNKLEDIVKNYRQYGYSDEIRNYCIEILTKRGVSIDMLNNRGFLVNDAYDKAVASFDRYNKFSIISIVLYFVSYVILPIVSVCFNVNLFWLQLISFIFFVFFMYAAYSELSDLFQMIDPDESKSISFSFVILGLFFFVFVYFVYRSKIKELINTIK